MGANRNDGCLVGLLKLGALSWLAVEVHAAGDLRGPFRHDLQAEMHFGEGCSFRRLFRRLIEIEAAQEILVRLPVTGVLGDDQPGHHFAHFARPLQRNGRQTLPGNDPLAAGHRQAFQIFRLGANLDGGQLGHILSRDTSPSRKQQ